MTDFKEETDLPSLLSCPTYLDFSEGTQTVGYFYKIFKMSIGFIRKGQCDSISYLAI